MVFADAVLTLQQQAHTSPLGDLAWRTVEQECSEAVKGLARKMATAVYPLDKDDCEQFLKEGLLDGIKQVKVESGDRTKHYLIKRLVWLANAGTRSYRRRSQLAKQVFYFDTRGVTGDLAAIMRKSDFLIHLEPDERLVLEFLLGGHGIRGTSRLLSITEYNVYRVLIGLKDKARIYLETNEKEEEKQNE